MVFAFDGSSERHAHIWKKTVKKYSFRDVKKGLKQVKFSVLLHMCATCSELPSNIITITHYGEVCIIKRFPFGICIGTSTSGSGCGSGFWRKKWIWIRIFRTNGRTQILSYKPVPKIPSNKNRSNLSICMIYSENWTRLLKHTVPNI